MADTDEKIYVCKLVTDFPHLKDETAVKGNCETCSHQIWHKIWAPTNMPKICWKCAAELVAQTLPDDKIMILPGVLARQEPN